jgi:hypothetical protein
MQWRCHTHYPSPVGALHYDTSFSGFRTTITEQMLQDVPQFSDDSWTDRPWEVQLTAESGKETTGGVRGTPIGNAETERPVRIARIGPMSAASQRWMHDAAGDQRQRSWPSTVQSSLQHNVDLVDFDVGRSQDGGRQFAAPNAKSFRAPC